MSETRGRLQDQVVIVTGAAGTGIGQTSARLFAREGAKLIISDAHEKRTLQVAEAIAEETGAETLGVVCDVRDREQVEGLMRQTVDRFGRIDCLMNNAGLNVQVDCVSMSDDQWNMVLDVCLRGTFYCVRAALPYMIESGKGSIVSMASTAGIEGTALQSHYSAAKAGIIAFTKAVAKEVAKNDIRLNCIAPGSIANPYLEKIFSGDSGTPTGESAPLGRRGEPRDVAFAALFLLSEEGGYMTGQTLSLSGGQIMIP